MSRHWHDLHSPASRTSLYLRAASKRSISGDQLPDDGLRCFIRVQPGNLTAYRRLCHFTDDGRLPGTYPHVMAFTLQLQLMTAPNFPFPLLGLVHLHNRIEVLRPLGGIEGLRFAVHAGNLQAHAKGGTFDLVTEAEDGIGLLWRETSRMLVRGLKLESQAGEPAEDEPQALQEATRLVRRQRYRPALCQGLRGLQPDPPQRGQLRGCSASPRPLPMACGARP
ncbi:dehydratase [Pseudomonas putida S11]|nr:dehydratase [Pseudomonas putida S11]